MANLLRPDGSRESVPADRLRKGDLVMVAAGEIIPADGEIIEGAATVDESAITGESAPVIREAGGDRSAVTGGTRVLSDRIKVRVTADPGESFLDRMISLVEGARRQKTPNEIALTILLSALTIIFLVVIITAQALRPLFRSRSDDNRPRGPARLPDPHDDRRPAERHRHRRDRPHGPEKCPGHERPGGRSRRRRRRPPPGQDRDDHPGRPPGGGLPPGSGSHHGRAGRAQPSSHRSPTKRPRGGASSSWPRSTACGDGLSATCPARPSSPSRPRPG